MIATSKNSILFPITIFLVAFAVIPLARMHGLELMPGDIGDARLNNYFLENIFLFFNGKSASLWHLGFLAPSPYVLGFSDNLFGSAPVYLAARALTGQPDTAFQIWFLVGYAANFAAAYYSLKRLNCSTIAASVGALIFAFTLPTTAQAGHAQLHYRFGVPLAALYLILFLEQRNVRYLVVSGLWTVWQFYCSIYIGFFSILLSASITASFVIVEMRADRTTLKKFPHDCWNGYRKLDARAKAFTIVGLVGAIAAMGLLLFPYWQVKRLYGVVRPWWEIASMLPQPQSYLLADQSWIWSKMSHLLPNLPVRHEHQMFVGLVSMLLVLAGLVFGNRPGNRRALLAGGMGIMMMVTLYVSHVSLWYFLHKMPMASAIRAMARLVEVLLFPAAYLAALAIDRLRDVSRSASWPILVGIVVLIIVESGATDMQVSPKKEWRDRLTRIEAIFPKALADDNIVFIAQREGSPNAHDIDVMWASLNHGVETLNGYTGALPPGFSYVYGTNCAEVSKRVHSYLKVIQHSDDQASFDKLMRRIVPIGFKGCDGRPVAPKG